MGKKFVFESALKKTNKFSIDTNIGQKSKKMMKENCVKFYTVVMILLLLNGLNPSLLKQMTRGGGTARVVLFRGLFCGSQKKIKMTPTDIFFINNSE